MKSAVFRLISDAEKKTPRLCDNIYLISEVLPELIIIGDQFTRPDGSKVQDRQARCPWILLTLPGGRVANLNQVLAT